MAFFRDSYPKTYIGTKATTANSNQVQGLIVTAGLGTQVLATTTSSAATTYGVGSYGFFNWDTFKSVTAGSIGATAPDLLLVSASLRLTDQIAPFIGGYSESSKSKMIRAKLVTAWEKYVPCTARQETIHIGHTNYTNALSPADSTCNFTYKCGESYTLNLEIRKDPVRRYLNRDAYAFYTFVAPCCAEGAPGETIDGTLAYISWATQVYADPELNPFVAIIVFDELGNPLYPPGSSLGTTWDNYSSPGHTAGKYAGMRIQGAYVSTEFGTCSFQPTDYYNLVPVALFASMVNFNGDQCTYTGVCVYTECDARQGNGFGETILREEILTELYRQLPYTNDPRMREIEGGDNVLAAITRSQQYYRYTLIHNVPQIDNSTNSYESQNFAQSIISTASNSTLETFVSTWLANANSGVTLTTYSCGSCTPMSV